MFRTSITLSVIPPCHLRGSAEVRTVTSELETSPRFGPLAPAVQETCVEEPCTCAAYRVLLRV